MPEDLTGLHPASLVFALATLGLGAAFWLVPSLRPAGLGRTWRVSPWPLRWLDFGLWLWTLFIGVALFQAFVFELLPRFLDLPWAASSPDATSSATSSQAHWEGLAGGLCLQVPMLVFFFAFRRLQADPYRLPLSPSPLGLFAAATTGLRLFLLILPGIWFVNLLWGLALHLLDRYGFPLDLAPQDFVDLLLTLRGWPLHLGYFLLAVAGAPIAEELVFRGGIYPFLKNRLSPLPALVLSGALFALLHLNLLSFLPLLALGVALGLAYELTGDIRVPIAVHAWFNLHQLLFFYLNLF